MTSSQLQLLRLRNVVCSAIPTFAKWVDSLGGRMGAAGDAGKFCCTRMSPK